MTAGCLERDAATGTILVVLLRRKRVFMPMMQSLEDCRIKDAHAMRFSSAGDDTDIKMPLACLSFGQSDRCQDSIRSASIVRSVYRCSNPLA